MKALLRWILAVPLTMLAIVLLQAAPPMAIALMSQVELKFTLLNLVLGVVLVTPLFGLVSMWFIAVVMVPGLICKTLTSKPQIAMTIVGTLFVPLQVIYLIQLWRSDEPKIVFAYQVFFTLLLLIGLVVNGVMAGPEQEKVSAAGDPQEQPLG